MQIPSRDPRRRLDGRTDVPQFDPCDWTAGTFGGIPFLELADVLAYQQRRAYQEDGHLVMDTIDAKDDV